MKAYAIKNKITGDTIFISPYMEKIIDKGKELVGKIDFTIEEIELIEDL